METDKSFDGTAEDGAEGKPLTLGSLPELGLKEVGNAADETDGEVGTLVGGDVETEEVDESVDDELTHLRNVKVSVDEGGERSQKAVGQWLAVDLIDKTPL